MSPRNLIVAAALLLAATAGARADADADWAQIQAMDSNGPAQQWQSQDQARDATIEYLGKQEQALRAFIAAYPNDTHVPDVKLRLAHLLATLADFNQDSAQRLASNAILDELESEPAMKNRRADVEFARVSIFMQRVDALSGANRDPLLEKARAYAKEFPDDRRVAPLLAEVAGAFEEDGPKTARALLEQALPKAQTPELRARITDDLKRLALLGKPLEMRWTAIDGTRISLDDLRGKVVLIYFFATWSPPSMLELDWVHQLVSRVPADTLQPLGICLDKDPVALPSALADHDITWPVYCDGSGWQGQLVRGLGINAIPELWIVDRDGILRALDAKDDAVELIEKAAGDSGGQ
jgi:thiol-disulfide isomerase/thioredoxin